ncbi:MAG: alpha/beta fold hydrolase [Pseudomonadota bacterium]
MSHTKMNILREGATNGTPLVLVHGYTGDNQSWRLISPMLDAKRPVIMPDLPSHGISPLWVPDSFDAFVEEIASNLEEQVPAPFHLVGHSLGGAVAFALSKRMRAAIKSLTAVAPAGLGPEVDDNFIAHYPSATEPDEIRRWMQHIVGKGFELPEAMPHLVAEKRQDPERIKAQVEIGRILLPDGVQSVSVAREMEAVDVPCKIIWGKQDTLIPWEHALSAPASVGLHLMPEVGHMPNVEAPGLLARLIEENITAAGG